MKNFILTIALCFAGFCGCALDLSAQEYLPQRDESGKYGYKMGVVYYFLTHSYEVWAAVAAAAPRLAEFAEESGRILG